MDIRPNVRNLFSPSEVQRCLLCNKEYQPAVEPHACEIESDWTGCYRDSWKGLIVPDAFAHPAKFSRSLIHRIYAHAKEGKWLVPGSTVIDPFGGVALGGLEAAWHGAHWVGCELESKFVLLGQQNVALWEKRFGHMPTWGSVRLVQGDSRQLSSVLERAGLCVSSPPYAGVVASGDPEFLSPSERSKKTPSKSNMTDYGDTPGQLGAMVVSSPPFAGSLASGDPEKSGGMLLHDPKRTKDKTLTATYGTSDGNLGNMVVSSPPYEDAIERHRPQGDTKLMREKAIHMNYDEQSGKGNLGSSNGDDFWTAAREIVQQTYNVLSPNSYVIWVLKGFIRKKTYVDFPDQWRQLCEAIGFKTLHWHHAWLVEPGASQSNMLGEKDVDYTRERKSFFRRLAEKKGSPRIDFEVVLCMLRP
jgi:hypothetical protein